MARVEPLVRTVDFSASGESAFFGNDRKAGYLRSLSHRHSSWKRTAALIPITKGKREQAMKTDVSPTAEEAGHVLCCGW